MTRYTGIGIHATLRVVLQQRFVVLLVLVLENLVDLHLEVAQDEGLGDLHAAVEVEGGHHGLEGVAEDRARELPLLREAAAEDDDALQLQLRAPSRKASWPRR
jgi:hypothetical protein